MQSCLLHVSSRPPSGSLFESTALDTGHVSSSTLIPSRGKNLQMESVSTVCRQEYSSYTICSLHSEDFCFDLTCTSRCNQRVQGKVQFQPPSTLYLLFWRSCGYNKILPSTERYRKGETPLDWFQISLRFKHTNYSEMKPGWPRYKCPLEFVMLLLDASSCAKCTHVKINFKVIPKILIAGV